MDNFNIENLPEKYRPLSPWAYFGYTILYSIPIIGFIFLVIFAVGARNINKRNFARSYFCVLALILIFTLVLILLGAFDAVLESLKN